MRDQDIPLEYGYEQGYRYPLFRCKRINRASVAFNCPKCGRLNIHGWPRGETGYGGHRGSHCHCWPHGYIIELAEGEE
jgi:hypothetical protein